MIYISFTLLGATIGILSGFFGIGGGIILTPLLLILGYEASTAIVLSLLLTLGSTMTGTLSHLRLKTFRFRDAGVIGLTGIIGSMLITPVVFWLERHAGADVVLSSLYIVLLLGFSIQFLRPRSKERSSFPVHDASVVKLAIIGLAAGILSSLMGVSGGFLLTPLLIGWVRFPLKQAIGTSIASATLIVLGGVTSYVASGTSAPLLLGIALIIGAFIGSPLGASLLQRFNETFVQKTLGIFYGVVALSVIVKVFGLPYLSLVLLALFTLSLLSIFGYRIIKTA
ncbi:MULTISPECIES: sulfite exporter TauE/SafE family protein [unclassified Exiguobacterium]|uniref:sulfite exporter TauE/SafE family protein n=1 Tax=unclassified Exiguobacterium TaxID=2644629 RepID=UPI000E8DB4E8|nr:MULTISPECIES: sulfite exporter TauE/SafE family protein [unclassified Exiguobacterium]HBF58116.1 sulfite exporter TauE/SafE family protein [Exiguobacterium sp.]